MERQRHCVLLINKIGFELNVSVLVSSSKFNETLISPNPQNYLGNFRVSEQKGILGGICCVFRRDMFVQRSLSDQGHTDVCFYSHYMCLVFLTRNYIDWFYFTNVFNKNNILANTFHFLKVFLFNRYKYLPIVEHWMFSEHFYYYVFSLLNNNGFDSMIVVKSLAMVVCVANSNWIWR